MLGRSNITRSNHITQKDWQRILPGLVISAISLVIVFYFTDFERLTAALQMADYRLVLAAILLTLVWLALRGLVWRALLMEKATFTQVFWTLNEGYLLNNMLPFRLGELGRAFLLGKKAGIDFWQAFSSIVIERTMDLALAVGILLSSLPFVVAADWAQQAAFVVGGLVLLLFCALYLSARYRDRVIALFLKLSERWPLLLRLGGKAVPAFFSGLLVLTDAKRFIRVVVLMVINWLVAVSQYFVFILAFYPNARPQWAFFGLGVVALGVAAPSSPGAVGILELSLVGALALFGLDASVSLALAITIHLCQYLVTGILGAYALSRDGESLIGLYRQMRLIRKDES